MEAFVRVVETGSFSAAARQLHLGQPAVSKAVAQLEHRLGVRLLVRSTRGLSATEAGQQFYLHARSSVSEGHAAELAARGEGAALTGRLRVCAAVTFARIHIIPKLARFLEQNPALDVDIVLDDRNVDLIESGVDVALRMGSLVDSTMMARRIAESPRFVVGTPAYFRRAGTPRMPEELAAHETVIYDRRGGGTTFSLQRGDDTRSVTLHGRVRVNAAEGVREAVLADLGLTITSAWMFSPELASRRVIRALADWSLPPIGLWALFPTGRYANAKARAFVQFIEDELG